MDLTSPEGPKPATPPVEAPDLPFNVMLTCYTLFERVREGVLVKPVVWCPPVCWALLQVFCMPHALPGNLPHAASVQMLLLTSI